MSEKIHKSVLLQEVMHYLEPKPGQKFIDATFGAGGHSLAILEAVGINGKVFGIEWNEELYEAAHGRFGGIKRLVLVNDNYRNLKRVAEEKGFIDADAILMDLGFSSWHIEQSGRGFSFQKDEPLDMRYSEKESLTAAEIVNQWPPQMLEKILKEYGEERFAEKISEAVVEARKEKPIVDTFKLVEVIKEAVPGWYSKGRLNPATKTFQALRIAVNRELENLKEGLSQAPEVLRSGGRLAVISFHSLEDRMVKNAFRDFEKNGIGRVITKKPVRPSKEEISLNPKSRSAKMRVFQKT